MTQVGFRVAVTGTDTGVGKTVVACALAAALRATGHTVAVFKPVETGVRERHAGTDAARLAHAAGDAMPLDVVCPIVFDEPLAPWIAAERAARPIDVPVLDGALARAESGCDALIVEGAGGLLVPFTRALTFADLAARWSLDLVVVAANRLGVLNHTCLTVREAARRGLTVRAVALVEPPADDDDLAPRTNGDALAALVAPVPVVSIARLPDAELAAHASLARLGAPLLERLMTAR